MNAVSVVGLRAGYGTTAVIEDLDLTLEAGRLTCVLGPSGCGKTTLLRVVAGFVAAQAGTVTIGNTIVDDAEQHVRAEHRRVGYVPQDGALFPHLTVAGNIGFALARRGRADRAVRAARVEELIELVGLHGLSHRRPHELSGGQRQRVALGRALANRPHLVLLDEPFSALDAGLRRRLRTDVRDVLALAGVTALLVTHDQNEALSLGHQVVLMHEGRIIQAGTPQAIYATPRTTWAAGFVGDVTIVEADVSDRMAMTPLGRLRVEAPDGRRPLAIRPEQIRLSEPGRGPGAGHEQPIGIVTGTEYMGDAALVTIRMAGPIPATVTARLPGPTAPPELGTTVAIGVEGHAHALEAGAPGPTVAPTDSDAGEFFQ